MKLKKKTNQLLYEEFKGEDQEVIDGIAESRLQELLHKLELGEEVVLTKKEHEAYRAFREIELWRPWWEFRK
jgi:hypothetical protein